jgi:uncharacterized oligopeptide transporter (OPT) family protein
MVYQILVEIIKSSRNPISGTALSGRVFVRSTSRVCNLSGDFPVSGSFTRVSSLPLIGISTALVSTVRLQPGLADRTYMLIMEVV